MFDCTTKFVSRTQNEILEQLRGSGHGKAFHEHNFYVEVRESEALAPYLFPMYHGRFLLCHSVNYGQADPV